MSICQLNIALLGIIEDIIKFKTYVYYVCTIVMPINKIHA